MKAEAVDNQDTGVPERSGFLRRNARKAATFITIIGLGAGAVFLPKLVSGNDDCQPIPMYKIPPDPHNANFQRIYNGTIRLMTPEMATQYHSDIEPGTPVLMPAAHCSVPQAAE